LSELHRTKSTSATLRTMTRSIISDPNTPSHHHTTRP
jgi:hypothetical protein